MDGRGNIALFFGKTPFGWVIGIVLVTATLAAVGATYRTLSDTEATARTEKRIAWVTFWVEWLLLVGLLGRHPALRGLIGLLLLLPLPLLLARYRDRLGPLVNPLTEQEWEDPVPLQPAELRVARPPTPTYTPIRSQRRSNPRLEEELAWLAARYPNPVFLANMRLRAGSGSLRAMAFGSLLGFLPIALLLAMAIKLGEFSPQGPANFLFGLCTLLFVVPWLHVPPARTAGWWMGAEGADQLTVTPLKSHVWIEGQVAAGFLTNLCRFWNVTIVMGLCLLWLLTTPRWGLTMPGFLTVFTLLMLGPTFYGLPESYIYNSSARKRLQRSQTWIVLGVVALLLLIIVAGVLGSFTSSDPTAGALGLILCLPGLFLPVTLVRARIRHGAEELELLRRGEAEWKLTTTTGK